MGSWCESVPAANAPPPPFPRQTPGILIHNLLLSFTTALRRQGLQTPSFEYWSDERGTRHLTIVVGKGRGAFANENCLQGRAFDQSFESPRGLPGWMLAAGIDSHIIYRNCKSTTVYNKLVRKNDLSVKQLCVQ